MEDSEVPLYNKEDLEISIITISKIINNGDGPAAKSVMLTTNQEDLEISITMFSKIIMKAFLDL